MKVECQNCGRVCDETKIIPLEDTPDLLQRISPGEVVPVGECRKCGALCHYVPEPIYTAVFSQADGDGALLAEVRLPKRLLKRLLKARAGEIADWVWDKATRILAKDIAEEEEISRDEAEGKLSQGFIIKGKVKVF